MSKFFKTGSLKELWNMSYPMMISFLSLSVMLFVDRLFLARYSSEALNASVVSGTFSWAFICGIMTLTAMSEVFVSQFNGAGKNREIGKPIWQMLWFCLFSFAFFIPVALLITPYVFPIDIKPLENAYFSFFMYTGPLFCIHSAVAGFFIGRGYPKVIQWMAIISNVVNVILDPILIFGIDGYVPSFGMMGAAYATVIGTLVQAAIVFLFFISKKNAKEFGTRDYRFDKKLFLSCLRIGIPPAVFIAVELFGWTLFYFMMEGISKQHLYVAGVCQSILILFFFVGWGIEKGCVALAGNFIGQKKPHLLNNVLQSSLKLLAIFAVLLGVILFGFADSLIYLFSNSSNFLEENTPAYIAETKGLIKTSLYFIFFYIIFENIRWALNGLLTAAGDTIFLLVAGTLSLWVFCFIPTYFLIYLPKASILYAYGIQVMYGGLSTLVVYLRYKQGKWTNIKIVKEDTSPHQEILEDLLRGQNVVSSVEQSDITDTPE
jgi:MATE family multidrug resistance protein